MDKHLVNYHRFAPAASDGNAAPATKPKIGFACPGCAMILLSQDSLDSHKVKYHKLKLSVVNSEGTTQPTAAATQPTALSGLEGPSQKARKPTKRKMHQTENPENKK